MAEPSAPASSPQRRQEAQAWFSELRDRICAAFESIEDDFASVAPALAGNLKPGRFERKLAS